MATTGLVVGDYVWASQVSNGEFDIPVGGKIVAIESSRVKIVDDDEKQVYVSKQQVLKLMHISSEMGVDDMINLGDLQEYAILRNLHKRYKEKKIYTYTGTMLVAVNPYEFLPIYTNSLINEYKDKTFDELPPHIFAVGDNSYNDMKKTRKNQCIVISGESGAGKTESTKLILQYLASTSGQHSWIEQQILEANPILEAFGNAKTVRNDNSSRFGKYINIDFNTQGAIEGAKIAQYLLEKSRIVSQNEGERNYHIFYSMLAGLPKEDKKRLGLSDPEAYEYLIGGKTLSCDGRDEAKEFSEISGALKVLNFSDKESNEIFILLAAILHLGNLRFKSGSSSHSESSDVADQNLNERISSLLAVSKVELAEALTKRTIYAHGDTVVATLSKQHAAESRNAFSKGIYGKMFIMIVNKINEAIYRPKIPHKKCIGVLDIFGFENFKVNSFEQLCINYANENLQQFFVQHIFKLEQDYYTNEGINWSKIEFIDNQQALDMIGLKPMNVLSLIDEETKFPKGTDFSMLTKLHGQHGGNRYYLKPKSDMTPSFGIQHFAGSVFYDVPGFLDKNRDSFSQDLKNLIAKTRNDMLRNIFQDELGQEANGKKMVTLSSQFKTSLELLMNTLGSCHPFFVRCIKPNELKKPQIFDRALCCRQLRYSGMMETAKIRQAGYPIRYTYEEFVDRFRYLGKAISPSSKGDCKESTKKICAQIFQNGEDFQLGHTKIFLKHIDSEKLEELRSQLLARYILVLQKAIKGWIQRRRFLRLRAAAIVFQKHFRARGFRSRYLKLRNGYQRLQSKLRSRLLCVEYQTNRKNIISLQARARGYLSRTKGPLGRIYGIVRQKKIDEAEFRRLKKKNALEEAEELKRKRLADAAIENNERQLEYEDVEPGNDNAAATIDKNFAFLDSTQISSFEDPILLEKQQSTHKSGFAMDPPADIVDISEYTFRKYAATYFAHGTGPQHSRKPPKTALHELPTPDDVLAAQALWAAVSRFMGDMPEPKISKENEGPIIPVMAELNQTISRGFTNRREYQQIVKEEQRQMNSIKKSDRQKLINMTLKRKNKLLEDVKRGLVEDTFALQSYSDWVNCRRTNNLEKLHFVIGHGILRPELRDEILCIICKQLTNNYSRSSYARGWILLSLCVGCFLPSDRFLPYLRAFIQAGPPGYAPFTEGRLKRTMKNGNRTQPPTYLELIANKNKKPVPLHISLLDDSVLDIEIDSATTAEEVITAISKVLNLKDTFGFSLFISLYDKVMSLGSESDHVLDAISQCEQYSKELGHDEKNSPWRMFLRKEMFAPWHDPAEDPVATDLIYQQIFKGLKTGEYRSPHDGDVATLIATRFYIEEGAPLNPKVLQSRIGEFLPLAIVKHAHGNLDDWLSKITDAFQMLLCVKKKMLPAKAKEFIVIYGKSTWPILFSKFYEALQISGPELPKKNVIIAINWTGIYMIDDQEQILAEFTFADIFFITFEQSNNMHKVLFTTVAKEEYVFHTPDAKDLCSLIQFIIDGLRKRSVYCVATQDYKPEVGESFLSFKKGDLITLKNNSTGKTLLTATWGYGECNGKSGDFHTEMVYILPTLAPPPQDILVSFKKDIVVSETSQVAPTMSTIQRMKLYTLSHYGEEHFRSARRITPVGRPSVFTAARRNSKEELWKYTNEPIYQPMLQKVSDHEEASKEACNIFTSILRYMGDLPAPKAKYSNEYTDQIFASPLKIEMLKDELYCQIMRQLTFNRMSLSEEKGWELMYLLTGLFVPSISLLEETRKFLKSRVHPFIEPCLQRLQKTQKVGPRKFPPYSIEVEAIQARSMEIYHKIYFPDDSDEAFEVDAMTRASELCKNISVRLDLEAADGFSLFVAISDKVFSIPEDYFFYDFLSELMNWMRSSKPSWGSAAPVQAQYQVFFMKKLWVNTVPGKCPNADQIFHYHQEVPKYLKGYHKCSKQDAVKLASFILRARFDSNDNQVQSVIQNNYKEFIPQDLQKAASSSEWKKAITSEYLKLGNISIEQAKEGFLKAIYNWPTFGSTFFEVKQTTEPSYPEIVIIAINKRGVNIIHPQTKDILAIHDYAELANWGSGNTYFQLTIGNIMRKTKVLCETSQGYKMDDLITSYIRFFKGSGKKEKEQVSLF
ncbi:myosin-VIIa isoform X2 [Dendroctonus ponderosae]|uniref:myosin-VIIa isoform X2 n=1 Tax=Dendroctonus ponderosae TaxID=77166 RepID=UPI002034DC37|nr:myosin-VIIa isoform X2 [Dendroctonus ponderosae]